MPHTGGVRSTIPTSYGLRVTEVLLVGGVGAVVYQLVHDAGLPAIQEVSMESVTNIVHLGVGELVPGLVDVLCVVVSLHEHGGHHHGVSVGAWSTLPVSPDSIGYVGVMVGLRVKIYAIPAGGERHFCSYSPSTLLGVCWEVRSVNERPHALVVDDATSLPRSSRPGTSSNHLEPIGEGVD